MLKYLVAGGLMLAFVAPIFSSLSKYAILEGVANLHRFLPVP
jgi:hypothetical protein